MILTLEIVGHQSGLPGFSGSKQFGPNGGTIGRLPDNDWVLPDPYISGRHALIRYVGGKFYIEDISTNGVFLNAPDNRLQRSRPQLLEEGDRLYIDEYEIGVRLVSEVPAEPPPPTQVQQRPFSPVASTIAMPVMAPPPAARQPQQPPPAPVVRPQPRPQPQATQLQPPGMGQGVGVPPATLQMPAPAPVMQPPPSVEPIMVARPSAPVPPPATRPVSRRVASSNNDPLRLLGLDDRRQTPPPAPAPVARVPDLLEMGRPSAVPSSISLDSRNADLMGSSLGFTSPPLPPLPNEPSLDPFPIEDANRQDDDLSLAPLREAPSQPSPGAPGMEPLQSMGMNGSNGYRSGNPNIGAKLGAMGGMAELARKASNGAADATLAYPPATQASAATRAPIGSTIIPDDYDPLEDDIGSNAVSGRAEEISSPPPTPPGPANGRMTMAQPPAAPPRRPAVAQPAPPPAKPEMAAPRATNPVPRMPSPPIMASPSQQMAPQNTSMGLQQPAPAPAKAPPPVMVQPPAAAPPSIPTPTPPGPGIRTPAASAAPAGASRPTNGVAPRTEEPNRPMIPPPSVPRPTRPAVVPYPGRKPSMPTAANGVAVPQQNQLPAAVPAPAQLSAPPLRTQAQIAPPPSADAGALAAILEAAGLDVNEVGPEFSSNLGRILRVAVTGMIEVLRAQQSIKDEFRMRMTAFKNVDNNPLKLSGSPEEALQSLFARQSGNQLRPVEAFEEAFREVRNHELAMLDGMRVAYEFMLSEFDPDRVQEDFNSSSGRASILGKSAKSRYWDFYREKYGEIISDGEASFRNRFGDEFAKAYEEQLERLNALDRNRGK